MSAGVTHQVPEAALLWREAITFDNLFYHVAHLVCYGDVFPVERLGHSDQNFTRADVGVAPV